MLRWLACVAGAVVMAAAIAGGCSSEEATRAPTASATGAGAGPGSGGAAQGGGGAGGMGGSAPRLSTHGKTWRELARFISSYHREGHYTVDATPMLVHLKKGGVRQLRYIVSPDWNQQAYLSRVDFRFSNKKKGYSPIQAVYLWGGGDFNSGYNANFKPIDVDIPARTKHAEIWALITGHGGANYNCAEFCNHQHQFTINGKSYVDEHLTVGKQDGCVAEVDQGMVPNQGGTWWFGRGGWCPGEQVNPFVADVTADDELPGHLSIGSV